MIENRRRDQLVFGYSAVRTCVGHTSILLLLLSWPSPFSAVRAGGRGTADTCKALIEALWLRGKMDEIKMVLHRETKKVSVLGLGRVEHKKKHWTVGE